MRTLRAIILLLITTGLVYLLNNPIAGLPAIGKLLDPINGCWANAEPVDANFTANFQLKGLRHPVTVWFDDRMVAHVHATDNYDLYFAEGYIHAYFRLWQMDMETRAAAGRVSEVIGEKALKFDRTQRRKGMVYGAENSLQAIEADPRTKDMMDAYTAGINTYIATLSYKNLPVEYKLIGFEPENWTNLKSALLLKYMADDLTGYTEDIPLTFLRDMLPKGEFEMLFPERIKGSRPVIPAGTAFEAPSLSVPAAPGDSVWYHFKADNVAGVHKEIEGKGSNNWVLSGSRTKSGAAILCNDPHLGLNLPSLWYEMQLQTPDMNVYGVSLPGAPGIVIGFNDSIAWGFTNNYRDVKDFYAIKPIRPNSGNPVAYWYDGKQVPFKIKIEKIAVKNGDTVLDRVNYTVQGPVMYDEHFPAPGNIKTPLALCWMAHKGTNELLSLYLLNRARSYTEFMEAIMHFECPGQNMAYADKAGNIAIWGQGQFVNKWKEQGRYIMSGTTSATMWDKLIPMRENPHVLNPEQGFVCSANQTVTDSTYPYWYNGYFYEFRAWRINQVLDSMRNATVQDMFALQNDTYSILAANTLPVMLKYLPGGLNGAEKEYADELRNWDHRLDAESKAATMYQVWWSYLYAAFWQKRFAMVPENLWPTPELTMQMLQEYAVSDTAKTGLPDVVNNIRLSYKQTVDSLNKLKKTTGLEWYKVKNTTIAHLAKLPAFSYGDLKIGGWENTVNAAKSNHGPSWRMVVQMSKNTEAYGVYPGGQSGNPGSKYYASFLQSWVAGKYYHLLFLPNSAQQNNSKLKYTWTLQP